MGLMGLFCGMPFPVQFCLAFVIVLGLIGATAWAVRRFGTGALGSPHLRGRQPRLAVLEHTLVEGRRRLYLVRRDNVEHLLLIGGPTDIVVEPNIVRATAAAREAAVARPPAADALPRAIPLPDSPGNGSWPLQPEPMAPVGAPRPVRIDHDEQPAWPLQPQTDSRTQRDALAALADEVSPRSGAPRNRAQGNARPAPVQYTAPEPPAADADQSLAEMAHRLEAALRKPSVKNEQRPSPTVPRTVVPDEQAPAEEVAPSVLPMTPPMASPPPRGPRVADAKPPRAEGKQANGSSGKTLYDNLEQEMASLLGRPAGKT
jgi:flagellar protein FliO/FliZ